MGEDQHPIGFRFGLPALRFALASTATGSIIGLCLALPSPASAVTLADNLNETTSNGVVVGYSTSSIVFNQGMKFNTTSASLVKDVVVKLQKSTSPATQGSVFFDIYSDNGSGSPGAVVATLPVSFVASSIPAASTDFPFPPLSIPLLPNSSYYLVARSDNFARGTSILWNYTENPTGFGYTPPLRVRSADGGSTFSTFAISHLQLKIEADVVPVPGPLPLLGAAAAFGWSRRLRRRIGSGSAVKGSSGSHSA